MKLTYILSLIALPLGALASSPTDPSPPSLVRRDLAVISSAAASVSSSIKALDTAVKAFTTDAAPVTAAAKKLAESVTAGAKAIIAQSSVLSFNDAMSLQPVVESLTKDGTELLKSLREKRGAIEKSDACGPLRNIMAELASNAEKLIAALVQKAPESLRDLAKKLASGVVKSIKKGQDNIVKCKSCSYVSLCGAMPAGNKTTTRRPSNTVSRPLLTATASQCLCPCACSSPPAPPPSSRTQTTTTTTRPGPVVTAPPSTSSRPPAQNATRPPTSATITAGGNGFSVGGQSFGLAVVLAGVAAIAL